jgi:hypothetical protein
MSRRDWLAAAVITVVAVVIAVFLLRDTSDDPAPRSDTDRPSARVMSVAAADDLMGRLARDGWSCFDSLPKPVVKRCFLDRAAGDGTVSGEVALTYLDDYVARVNVYAAGQQDANAHVALAEQTASLVGDVLLDGAGSELADHVGVPEQIEVAGRMVSGHRSPGSSVQVTVESAAYDDRELPPPDLPSESELVRTAEAGGLSCGAYGSTTTCGGSGSPSMTVTMAKADGRVGSLSISASNFAVPDDPVVVTMVSGYLFEAGVGGPRAGGWLSQHADSAVPVRADLGGVHLRLRGGDDHSVYLTVGEILN